VVLDVARQTNVLVVGIGSVVHVSDVHILAATVLTAPFVGGVPRTPEHLTFAMTLRARRGVHTVSLVALAALACVLIKVSLNAAVSFALFALRMMML
jgi:hypothetical protein